jgi:exosortase A-associated hydrolase 2
VKPTDCQPFFLDGARGPLFAVHHRPTDPTRVLGHVLCVPPFNEEMNRCRSMVTLQALALAEQGLGTLVVDPFGTGDSAGDHADARWDVWLDDLARASAWLDGQPGGCVALWGIRLGAILAAALHQRRATADTSLLLWQPVADGRTHLTQFLRVKIAAQMDRADLPKETTATMRAALAAGQTIEVAGYALHPELTAAIDAARLDACRIAPGTRMLWLENAVGDPPDLTPASRTLLVRWPGEACEVEARQFAGPAFWQVHERVLAPEAIELTSSWLDQRVMHP